MSKPLTPALLVAMAIAAGVTAMPSFARAAELAVVGPRHAARWCGPCGCMHVSLVYHRELRTTYGTGFDPRNYDTQEPHYYFGPMRAWPRFWVAQNPVQ